MDSGMYRYACIDGKSFYSSVECVDRGLDPLTTNLVVADEERTDGTICLAVSPSLKAYGISGRARLFEVKQRLAEIKRQTGKEVNFIIAKPRMKLYEDISAQVCRIFLKYIDASDLYVYSIDESFMSLTKYLGYYNATARELVSAMIHDVLATLGTTATAGIGTNLYLAKVAMDITAKKMEPDEYGVRLAELTEESFRDQLWDHQPLTDFWGIGSGISSSLAEMGIYTMGDLALLAMTNQEVFYRRFGINAEIIIDHAFGLEPCKMEHIKAYKPSANSLSNGQQLIRAYAFEEARLVMMEMVDSLFLDMEEKGFLASGFTIFVSYDRPKRPALSHGEDDTVERAPSYARGTVKLKSSTIPPSEAKKAIMALFDAKVDHRLKARHLGISANKLSESDDIPYQVDLFSDTGKADEEHNLLKSQVAIKNRFGKNAVFRAYDLLEGATTIERNKQIGGHRM